MALTLNWSINAERGTASFGKLPPFAGNTYEITVTGAPEGTHPVFYVMGDDGVTCLAKSTYDTDDAAYSIAFDSTELRDAFQREAHEARSFHCYARIADGTTDGATIAENDLTVIWNPLWKDTSTGETYTMKGPQGAPGTPGTPGTPGEQGKSAYEIAIAKGFVGTEQEWLDSLRGDPGSSTMLHDTLTDLWHKVYIKQNAYGDYEIDIDQVGEEYSADTSNYVSRTENQTVAGIKTFTSYPIIPDIGTTTGGVFTRDTSDDSYKAVCTKWLQAWWLSAKTTFLGATNTWVNKQTFSTCPDINATSVSNGIQVKTNNTEWDSRYAPATLKCMEIIDAADYYNKQWSRFRTVYNTDGSVETWITNNRVISGANKQADIKLGVSSTGSAYFLVPEPPANDDSQKAATTAFVQDALGSITAGNILQSIENLTPTAASKTKTYTGLTANAAYKVLVFWESLNASASATIDGTATTGRTVFGRCLNKTANANGQVSFTYLVSNTTYVMNIVAILIKV